MKIGICALGAFMLFATASARADVIYNLTLTSSTPGNPGGSGSFTINTPPPAVGTVNYLVASGFSFAPGNNPGTPGDVLLAFNATLLPPAGSFYNGASFSLANIGNPDYPYVTFTDGVPTSFYGLFVQGGAISYGIYDFGVGAQNYSYSDFRYTGVGFPTVINDSGTVTITPATAAVTPEPSTLITLLTGTAWVVGLTRRRAHRSVVC